MCRRATYLQGTVKWSALDGADKDIAKDSLTNVGIDRNQRQVVGNANAEMVTCYFEAQAANRLLDQRFCGSGVRIHFCFAHLQLEQVLGVLHEMAQLIDSPGKILKKMSALIHIPVGMTAQK